jgi:hypothetical protein
MHRFTLSALLLVACGDPADTGRHAVEDAATDASSDSDTDTDADADDTTTTTAETGTNTADPLGPVTVRIENRTGGAVYLEGSQNRECDPPYYRLQGDDGLVVDRPPFLACTCDDCGAVGCQGLADTGPGYAVLDADATAEIAWDGMRHVPGETCQGGCWDPRPTPSGAYTVSVAFTRAEPGCLGDLPLASELSPPPGASALWVCMETSTPRCMEDAGVFVETAAAEVTGPVVTVVLQ